ncbi:hypothetical protein EDI_131960 [Entamoeba dispar SAW760]|uniref:DNA-directed RNA polymerase III subunit RPC4 n=1 Tax=Entamoeba dispar (strain ATCC PRA-260 / SAW760) TaxID=370354 RepID=B0E776_ENTDS|nr:uncharacterized protein EDI_131960 [Entamoeba dispar SAW760]EDR29626.1 hypothetical protein EDI_131960 [Entamoeba dispar SAW760]|eukprot:EDR29626.1 hypothetical protein EDI_131960 [Entamoeba dispar SAW760]
MSEPHQNIPLSQLLTQNSQNTANSRLTSIRGIQPSQPKIQFAPNIRAAGFKPEANNESEGRAKLKVKKEQAKIKKTTFTPTPRVFKPRPVAHGNGGLGISNLTMTAGEDIGMKEENKKEKKKTLLLNPELDFDPCNPNHPITLPLRDPEEEIKGKKEEIKEPVLDKEKTYYTPLETIEENPGFINNPLHSESGILYDEYIMMQIPSVLPIQKGVEITEKESNNIIKKEEEKEEKIDEESNIKLVENPLKGMSGYIGTIQFRKSGIATMRIGGITYKLTKGTKPHFLEEATVVSLPKKSVYRLGNISQHVIMIPELEDCLNLM